MSCRRFHAALAGMIDGDPAGEAGTAVAAAALGHLSSCPACRDELRTCRDTVHLLRAACREADRQPAPPALVAAILRQPRP